MTDIVSELSRCLGADAVLTGTAISERATSYWDATPMAALALVRPGSTADLSRVMSICHAHRQPVVVHGGLTGCVSGAVASPGELIISLERMKAIEAVDVECATAMVEAGVTLQEIQERAAAHDLLFPLDLGARGSCTIGGNIATNAGGINVLRYGMMRNLVLGLEVVTADGTVLSSMNQMLKNNAGYDLKQLFIGSEGTLGIVTRAVLRLYPRPTSTDTALVATNSFDNVIALLQSLRRGLAGTLSAYEVMWGDYFRAVTEEGGHRPPMSRDHGYYVVLEAEGADPAADTERFETLLQKAFEDGLLEDAVIAKSGSERRALWDIREVFDDILPAYLYDVSLPVGAMAQYVDRVIAAARERWPQGRCYVLGHIADGNLHLFMRPGTGGDSHAQSDQLVYGPLQGLCGSVSAEHGIGTEKIRWLGSSRSQQEIEVMRMLKRSFDPHNLLNPGRVLAGS